MERHYYIWLSYVVDDIEDSDDTITTTTSKKITTVTEINREGSSTEISDLSTWFKHVVSVKYFDFIDTWTSRNNKITCVLLKLRGIY